MKKLVSLMLVVLLFLTAGCKKAPEQDETGALLPPEVLEEQTEGVDETQEQAESADETKEQTDAEKPFQVFPEEQPSADSSGEKNSGNAEPQEQASTITKTVFNNGKHRAWTPISLDGVPRGPRANVSYLPIEKLEDLRKTYNLSEFIVFKGTKQGLITPIEEFSTFWEDFKPLYCETTLRISKVFYGDIQVGDVITCKENYRVYESDGKVTHYSLWDNEEPISDNEEYIFILKKQNVPSSNGEVLYEGAGIYRSFHKVADYNAYKSKVQNGTAIDREILSYEVLDYYLNQPETKLDLRKEALQYVENIPENATEEEILQALPEDKKELFDRMIKQYGTVTAVSNETVENAIS